MIVKVWLHIVTLKGMKLTMVKVIVTGFDHRVIPVSVAIGELVLLVLILLIFQKENKGRRCFSIH